MYAIGFSARLGQAERQRQLLPGSDLKFLVDAVQVVLDGLRAQVQLGRGLTGRPAFGDGERDLQLLGRERQAVAVVPRAGGFSARALFGQGPLRPGRGAQALEGPERRAQLAARLDAAPGSA